MAGYNIFNLSHNSCRIPVLQSLKHGVWYAVQNDALPPESPYTNNVFCYRIQWTDRTDPPLACARTPRLLHCALKSHHCNASVAVAYLFLVLHHGVNRPR